MFFCGEIGLRATVASLNVFSETIKIGYIDTEQVVNNLPQYQQNVDRLTNEFEPKKQELLDLFKYIELLRKKINIINSFRLIFNKIIDFKNILNPSDYVTQYFISIINMR